jgi:CRP/FNR family transcriptional regulator
MQVLVSMAVWVRHLLGLVEDLTLRDAVGRFARYLLEVSAAQGVGEAGALVELPSLKKHLASHLNLTSETFSRTLRRLSDAGLVSSETLPSGSAAIRILDRQGLADACEGFFPRV